MLLKNQELILSNQRQIAKDVFDMKKGISEMYLQVARLESGAHRVLNEKSSRPKSLDSFEKIQNENSVNVLEAKMLADPNYRAEFVNACVSAVVRAHRDMSPRNIALQLDHKILHENFWSTTAWSGGRQIGVDGSTKFNFSKHVTFISVFKQVIEEIVGTPITDGEFVEFVKGRTRNSGYTRKTNRQVASRKRLRNDNEAKHPDASSISETEPQLNEPNKENDLNNLNTQQN